jgi:hypothetical protein
VATGGRKPRWVTEHVHVPRRPFGTHAYVLSRRGAAKLLQRVQLASIHVDAVAWGLRELNLFCVHPMLAFQAFADSTIGDTKGGLEERLPHLLLDPYTRITLIWVFNEPIIVVPGLGLTLTIGRAMVLLVLGFAIAAARRSPALLAAHSALTASVFLLLRQMVRPATVVGREVGHPEPQPQPRDSCPHDAMYPERAVNRLRQPIESGG